MDEDKGTECPKPKQTIGKYISHFAEKGMPDSKTMKKMQHSVINYRRRLRADEYQGRGFDLQLERVEN